MSHTRAQTFFYGLCEVCRVCSYIQVIGGRNGKELCVCVCCFDDSIIYSLQTSVNILKDGGRNVAGMDDVITLSLQMKNTWMDVSRLADLIQVCSDDTF